MKESNKHYSEVALITLGVCVIIIELILCIYRQRFMLSNVMWLIYGFLIILANTLWIVCDTLVMERDKNSKKIESKAMTIKIISIAIDIAALICLFTAAIITLTTSFKEWKTEDLVNERITAANQDYQAWIKEKDEKERQSDNNEVRPEAELIEIDLEELLESEFHMKVSLYEGEGVVIFSLGENKYKIQKEEGKKISSVYKIENGTERKRGSLNMYWTIFYEDKSRGIIITEDQIRDLKLENANL